MLAPFAFALYFAVDADFGPDLNAVAALLVLLSLAAGWLAQAQDQPGLALGAAAASLGVFAVWVAMRLGGDGVGGLAADPVVRRARGRVARLRRARPDARRRARADAGRRARRDGRPGIPQAWAAASPLLFMRTLLGLDPWMSHRQVWVAPRLPDKMSRLVVSGIPLDGRRVSIGSAAGTVEVSGIEGDLELITAPRHAISARFGSGR